MATEMSKSTSLILPREISAQNNVSNEHAVTRAVKVSTTRAKDRRRERINVLKQKGSQPKPFFQAQPARHPSSDPGSSLAKRNEPDEWNSFSSATIDVETIPVHERESMLADSAGLLKSGRDRLLAEETVSGIHAKKTSMKEEELEAAGYATTDQKDSLDKFFTWQQLNDSTPFEASTEVSTKVSPEVASSTNKDKPLRHSEQQQHAQQGQRDLGQEVHALETAVNRQQRRRQRDRQSHRATLAAETLPPPQPLLSTPPPLPPPTLNPKNESSSLTLSPSCLAESSVLQRASGEEVVFAQAKLIKSQTFPSSPLPPSSWPIPTLSDKSLREDGGDAERRAMAVARLDAAARRSFHKLRALLLALAVVCLATLAVSTFHDANEDGKTELPHSGSNLALSATSNTTPDKTEEVTSKEFASSSPSPSSSSSSSSTWQGRSAVQVGSGPGVAALRAGEWIESDAHTSLFLGDDGALRFVQGLPWEDDTETLWRTPFPHEVTDDSAVSSSASSQKKKSGSLPKGRSQHFYLARYFDKQGRDVVAVLYKGGLFRKPQEVWKHVVKDPDGGDPSTCFSSVPPGLFPWLEPSSQSAHEEAVRLVLASTALGQPSTPPHREGNLVLSLVDRAARKRALEHVHLSGQIPSSVH